MVLSMHSLEIVTLATAIHLLKQDSREPRATGPAQEAKTTLVAAVPIPSRVISAKPPNQAKDSETAQNAIIWLTIHPAASLTRASTSKFRLISRTGWNLPNRLAIRLIDWMQVRIKPEFVPTSTAILVLRPNGTQPGKSSGVHQTGITSGVKFSSGFIEPRRRIWVFFATLRTTQYGCSYVHSYWR